MAISLVFIIHSQKGFFNKTMKLRIDSAASSGGQGKLTYFIHFPWPPLLAGLSSSVFCFLHLTGSFCL